MATVLIVGYGVVGKNLHSELYDLSPDIYDKYHTEYNTKKDIKYDFCFICVDTPISEFDVNNTDEIHRALIENQADIYIIKSTVLPNKAAFMHQAYKKCNQNIVFSPEYYGGTQHCNNFEFNFTILGGDTEDCIKVQQLLQQVYDARHTFHIVDASTACLAKYMENAWLATKVSFCGQFYELANKFNVNYETLRELFILDPRVNPSHTFIYSDHPYWKSHCLDKDVPAIAQVGDAKLLKDVIDFNDHMKDTNK